MKTKFNVVGLFFFVLFTYRGLRPSSLSSLEEGGACFNAGTAAVTRSRAPSYRRCVSRPHRATLPAPPPVGGKPCAVYGTRSSTRLGGFANLQFDVGTRTGLSSVGSQLENALTIHPVRSYHVGGVGGGSSKGPSCVYPCVSLYLVSLYISPLLSGLDQPPPLPPPPFCGVAC